MQKHRSLLIAITAALACLVILLPASAIHPVHTERVSVSSDETGGNGYSAYPSISADGRYIAFVSTSSDLVYNDSNDAYDVFVRDLQAGTTERILGGTGGGDAAISANGRYVAFTGVYSGTLNGIFVYDLQTGTSERVSLSSSGQEGNSDSYRPSISADGRYVAFESYATNFASSDTNKDGDIFVRDREAGTTRRVSVSSAGYEGNYGSYFPTISGDGQTVVFISFANNLVSGDTNEFDDIFVHNLQTGTTERVSVSSSEQQSDGTSYFGMVSHYALSYDGRYVAFESFAANLVEGDTNQVFDIFLRDLQMGTTERVSVGSNGQQSNRHSFYAALSSDARYVAFFTEATSFITDDTNSGTDIYVRDRQIGQTIRASVNSGNGEANGNSTNAALSADGRYVAFQSNASNLVESGDTNGWDDVFVVDINRPVIIPTPTTITNGVPQRNFFTTLTPTLTWNRVGFAAEYEIQVDDEPSFAPPHSFTTTVPSSELSTTITLDHNGLYYWRARGKSGGTVSNWSMVDTFLVSAP